MAKGVVATHQAVKSLERANPGRNMTEYELMLGRPKLCQRVALAHVAPAVIRDQASVPWGRGGGGWSKSVSSSWKFVLNGDLREAEQCEDLGAGGPADQCRRNRK